MAQTANVIQSSEQAPAQPSYVLRGHVAQIHAVHFLRDNTRLLTGDADGFVVLWSTATKRAVMVWKPHRDAILGLGSWDEKIITHGRDNKILVWQVDESNEGVFSTVLPIDDDSAPRKEPWLLHSLQVNSLNFCSFAMVEVQADGHNDLPSEGLLIANPGVEDGHINITSLPDEERIVTIPSPKGDNTGMVMAIAMCFEAAPSSKELVVVAGYEAGQACLWRQTGAKRHWQLLYTAKPHSQPILSLAIAPKLGCFFTSAADAVVARHPLHQSGPIAKHVQSKHAGQQGLAVRSDEKIFATAGWDGRMRVYSVRTMKELAVLKWHNEGCYSLSFADVGGEKASATSEKSVARQTMSVAQQREETAKTTHWLAAGSKDGKVSLWDIY